MNPTLAICMPTYNRAEILEKNLTSLIPQIRAYAVTIYISDNASSDNTRQVVERFQKEYPHINYSCNESNLGMDRNFEKVLKMCESEYAWFLSDDDEITKGFGEIVRILQEKRPTVLFLGPHPDIPEGMYMDKHFILERMAHGMSWMSSLIISRDVIRSAQFERFYGTWFVHTAVVLDYIMLHDGSSVYYKFDNIMCVQIESKTRFEDTAGKGTEIWAKGWTELIMRLPITWEEKRKYYRMLGKKNIQNSNMKLLSFRGLGHFNSRALKKYISYIRLYNRSPYFVLYFISVFPPSIAGGLRDLYRARAKSVKDRKIEELGLSSQTRENTL